MRFSSVEIDNYRQYKHLELEFKKGANDLQIIVGDNGTGKTNLLNAFTWCLYGNEPHLGNESKEKGEPKLNKSVILDMVEQGIEVEDVRVRIDIETEDGVLRVTRSVPFRVKGTSSVTELHHEASFSVVAIGKGSSKTYSADMAQTHINRILPESIREYFFFDGEQLDNYFEDSRSEVLKSAVHSISQIDSVTNMRKRTSQTAQELARKATPRAKSNIDDILAKVHEYEENYNHVQSNIEQDKENLEKVKNKISELEGKLRGLPDVGVLERRIDNLKRQVKSNEESYSLAIEDYCTFARNMYVDFSFYEAAKVALEAITVMEKDNQLPPAIDPSLLKSMLSAHMCEVCQRPLSEDEEAHIKELLSLYQIGTETSNLLTSMRGELRDLVRRVEGYPVAKKKMFKRLDAAQDALEQTKSDLIEAENDYSGCPNPEQLKLLRTERGDYEKERDDLVSTIGKREGYAAQLKNAAEKKRKEYKQAVKEKGLGDEFQVAADFGVRAAEILASVEKDVIDETRRMIEIDAEQLFKGLVWKDSKCDHIGLTSSYQLSLYDRYGFSCAGTCSAAERNLLALSFTLAMHKVSGFESPMFIDTPIARASGDNRTNFAATLANVSKSKQLILTFTPDEYSETIATVFDPIAASNLRLHMDGTEMVVTVKGGE